jgi:hypothetical protein
MDVLRETQDLYQMQKNRVKMDVEWEQKMQKTFPSLNQDIRLLKEMLDDYERRKAEAEGADIPDSI